MYDLSNGTDTLLFKRTQPNDVAVDPINGFVPISAPISYMICPHQSHDMSSSVT